MRDHWRGRNGDISIRNGGVFHNELQAGSYVFMDADYGKNLNEDGGFFDDFENSLFVFVTVMSAPTEDRALVDAGLKALAMDPPAGGRRYAGGRIRTRLGRTRDPRYLEDNEKVGLGDKLKLIPGHCDPTVNLYDWYVGYRGNRVEALWPIAARGMLR